MVDVNGSFSVDVLNVLVDGDFIVIVIVIDSVGNIVNVNIIGNVDSEVLLLIFDI